MQAETPRVSIALNAAGGTAVIAAIISLGSSFFVENDIGRAFCLGAFFTGLLGAVLLFGFAKVIDLLDDIRRQNVARTLADDPESD